MILFDNVKQNEVELLEKFKIKKFWKAKTATFELNPSLIGKNSVTGDPQFAKTRNMLPFFQAYQGDTDIEIRIDASGRQTKGKDGAIQYQTRRTPFEGRVKQVFKLDEFLFFFLNPKCFNSPFFSKGSQWIYKLKDAEADAQGQLDIGDYLRKSLGWIDETPVSELRIKLQAMKMTGQAQLRILLVGPSNIGDTEVKSKLVFAAIREPKIFHDEFNNETNDFYGVIQEAIDQGVLIEKYEGARQKWLFGSGVYKDEVIAVVSPGVDSNLTLRDALASSTDLYLKLKQAIAGLSIDKKIANMNSVSDVIKVVEAVKTLTLVDIVDKAIQEDVIAYERMAKSYYFVDAKGMLEAEVMYNHKKGAVKDHKIGLIQHLSEEAQQGLLAKIKTRLEIKD